VKAATVRSLEILFWQRQAAKRQKGGRSRDEARTMARVLTAEWNRGKRRG
jgi:hypothetical protein